MKKKQKMKPKTQPASAVYDRSRIAKYAKKLARKRAKAKRKLGPFERFALRSAGKKDARDDMTRENENGLPTTPFLAMEAAAHERQAADLWAKAADVLHAANALCSELTGRIKRDEASLSFIRKTHLNPPDPEALKLRYAGEESLSDEQIRVRRTREHESRIEPHMRKAETLESMIAADCDALGECASVADELVKLTRALCGAITARTNLRMQTYWEAVVRNSAEKLPHVPELLTTSDAEREYVAAHAVATQSAMEILERRRALEKARETTEKEAA